MMKQATINDLEVRYDISGQGPWLTLSHSLATDMRMWEPQLDALSRHFTLLRYDTRGHGGTTATVGPYSVEQLSDDAAGLLRHLNVTQTHWLGLSMGGVVGQMMSLRHPELLNKVVLADTNGQLAAAGTAMWLDRANFARSQGMRALEPGTLARWFTDGFRQAQPEIIGTVGAMIRQTPVEGYAGCCAALSQVNFLERLRTVKKPALVIVGEQDQGTPIAAAQAIVDHWQGAKLVVLAGAAHLSNIEQAQAFNTAVLDFLVE